MTDEERYPPGYENATIRAWRQANLPGRNLIQRNAMELRRHYTASAACVPARAAIFTGQYPSLNGVSQTDGAAKTANEQGMFWLDPNTIPTMGDYFRAAGYRTFYKGKWHISESDIQIPGSHSGLNTYDSLGNRDLAKEQLYLNANRLDDFGFSGYIGPVPHGLDARNSGGACTTGTGGRDVVYADHTIELLSELERSPTQPWLAVCSFVNPHDIVLFGLLGRFGNYDFTIDPNTPPIPNSPSDSETLLTKPIAQASYRRTYQEAFQPTFNSAQLRQLYYQMHKDVDAQILRVMQRLQRSPMYRDTIVVFLSDHGELLGSHGGLYQKWHCAYEEVIHVPCYIHNPTMFPNPVVSNEITSHIDLIPTLLGLAGLDPSTLRRQLATTHSDVQPLVGRDLSAMLRGQSNWTRKGEPIYFMTDDEPTSGTNQQNFTGFAYNSVVQPSHVETVVVDLPDGTGKRTWKLSRYFDNTQFWTSPCQSTTVYPEIGSAALRCQGITRTQQLPDQYEMYDLTADPYELVNLAHPTNQTPANVQTMQLLQSILLQQRQQKRLFASSGQPQGVPQCPQ